MTVEQDTNFGLVVISTTIIAVQALLTGFLVVCLTRRKIFNKEFLSQFSEEHYSYINKDIESTSGYPDMGCGRYSQKLSYLNWLEFNIAQRVHYNYLENVASILIVTLLGGWVFPIIASCFGFIYILGRLLYICYLGRQGYNNIWRRVGSCICDICFLGNFILSILTGVQFLSNGTAF